VDFELSPQAARDLEALVDFYLERGARLAGRFAYEYAALFEPLTVFPESGEILGAGVRRALMPQFPVWVFYRLNDRGLVLRLVHTSRSPDEWPTGQ
jgi:plasmid stabilization system protein ParE